MADLTLDELRARLHPTGDDGEWFARDELALMVEGIDAAIKQREHDAKDAARYRWLLLDFSRAIDLLTGADLEGTPAYEIGDEIDSAMAKESGR